MTFAVLIVYFLNESNITFSGNRELSDRDFLECHWNSGMVGEVFDLWDLVGSAMVL